MSANDEHAPAPPDDFEPIASYERLIRLREESPGAFMLQTSAAARYALVHYERQKARAEAHDGGQDM